jgi:NAD(P)-dependent dehydrogenase (short-subunit alcohol dehydrogenase family)
MEKTAIIVGASDGIGKQTAIGLSKIGYTVVAIGRNKDKLSQLEKQLSGKFETIQADVSLLSTTAQVATQIREHYTHIDLIIHTADVLLTKRQETSEGHELTLATNYLSRFLFNAILLDSLQKSPAPRIIHVAAAGMPFKLNVKDFPLPQSASSFKGHTVGQLANDYYGVTFAQKYPDININILNPGMVDTDIRKKMKASFFTRMLMKLFEITTTLNTAEIYAKTVIEIATGNNDEANHSVLINSKGKSIKPSRALLDKNVQKHVWEHTEKIIKDQKLLKTTKQ